MPSPFDPSRSPAENLAALRGAPEGQVFLVSTGPRDTGQSDFYEGPKAFEEKRKPAFKQDD